MESLGPREVVLTTPIHQRNSPSSGITAAAIGSAEHAYLGTNDGNVEEHKIVTSGRHARLRLVAKKTISRKAIKELCFVETTATLIALSDGILQFLNPETFEGALLSSMRDVTAIAVRKAAQVHLVVAQRMSASGVRFTVLIMPSSPSGRMLDPQRVLYMDFAERASVQDVDWVANKVLFRTALGYSFFLPKQRGTQPLFQIQDDAISRTQFLILPGAHALLLSDQVGIVIDAEGRPTGSPLTFPSAPSAMAAVGGNVVAVCGRGVYVYDLEARNLVQSLLLPFTTPGEEEGSLFVEHDVSGAQFLLISSLRIWQFKVSTPCDQVKHSLQMRDFSAAMEVMQRASLDRSLAGGLAWVGIAYAQMGLLMLEELMVADAMDIFLKCKREVFSPAQLFPLFPAVTEPWQSSVPQQEYWGMHEQMQPLDVLLGRRKAFMSRLDLAALSAKAERAIAVFLLKVREQGWLTVIDGIDTLAICLLSRQQMTVELMAFVRQPNHANVGIVEANLQACGNLNALAFLYANSGRPQKALEIWKGFVDAGEEASSSERDSSVPEQSTPSSSSREDAISNAVQLVKGPDRIDDSSAMNFLSWLLKTSPHHTLDIIKGRRLNQSEVLALLRSKRSRLLRSCLEYYVWDLNSSSDDLHNELAVLLIEEIQEALPERDTSVTTKQWAERMHSLQSVQTLREKLQRLLSQSSSYDLAEIGEQLTRTDLIEEQILVAEKAGNLRGALEGLAVTLGDLARAEKLCEQTGENSYVMLLEVLLHPTDGQPPLYREACQLLSTHGANLDPMLVVETLSDDMPLTNAANVLFSMLSERLHRRRQGLLLRNLRRALHFSAAADRVTEMQGYVVVQEGRRCQGCHLQLGNKLFAAYPDGRVLCYACADKVGLQASVQK